MLPLQDWDQETDSSQNSLLAQGSKGAAARAEALLLVQIQLAVNPLPSVCL